MDGMDDARARIALRRIADVLRVPVADLYAGRGGAGPDDDELSRVLRAFLRVKDGRARRRLLEALEAAADGDNP